MRLLYHTAVSSMRGDTMGVTTNFFSSFTSASTTSVNSEAVAFLY